MNPIKILEIKGQDWMKGLSIQAGLALGGLFQTAYSFDPFETMGYFQPALSPVTLDSATLSTQVNYLTSFCPASGAYVFAIGDRAATAGKCLYRINMASGSYAVTDYSDQIDQNDLTDDLTHAGLIYYKGRIIYGQKAISSLRSNTWTPTIANDVEILTTASIAGGVPIMFHIAPDGNLYYTATGNYSIGKIVLVTGTTGNTNAAFTLTSGYTPKDLTSDGIYEIIIADTNEDNNTKSTTSCQILFWNMIKAQADVVWDIPDSYLIAARYVDGKALILGSSGIWACNSVTPPKLVYPLVSSQLPSGANKVTTQGNILYWATATKIYGYGSKLGKPILFTPYELATSSNALISSGTYLVSSVLSDATPKVYLHNGGSTRANATIQTATLPLTQPFKFEFAKIVLKAPLSSGQQVYFSLLNGNGSVVSDTDSKAFATYGAKQTLIFTPKAGTNNFKQFEDLVVTVTSNGGAVAQRVSIYGVPITDDSQNI